MRQSSILFRLMAQAQARAGWGEVLRAVAREVSNERLSLAAAGVAFYGFLALFPAIWVAVSLYGLFQDPAGLEERVAWLYGVLPPVGAQVIEDELRELVAAPRPSLTLGFALGLIVSLWSSINGIRVLIATCNAVYKKAERRSFFALTLLAALFVLGSVVVISLAVALLVVLPAIGARFDVPIASAWLRWPVVGLVFLTFSACLYRFAPNRKGPGWQWVSWGTVTATTLWLAVSALFTQVVRFGALSRTYGALTGTAVVLIWLYLSVMILLVGAELNEELEELRGG